MDHSAARPPLALVTGASSGIGRALAQQFVKHGHDVVIAADEPEIERTAIEIATASGQLVTPVQVDLSTSEGVRHLYDAATAGCRGLDAVALNAGIGVHGRFDTTDLDEDLRLVDLNCRSVVHLAKLAVRDMVARGEGRVLVTASIAAKGRVRSTRPMRRRRRSGTVRRGDPARARRHRGHRHLPDARPD